MRMFEKKVNVCLKKKVNLSLEVIEKFFNIFFFDFTKQIVGFNIGKNSFETAVGLQLQFEMAVVGDSPRGPLKQQGKPHLKPAKSQG
jgi:hypothetical protein